MSYYDANVGACPPYGPPAPYGYGYGAAYAPPAFPLAGPAYGDIAGFPYYDLIGQPAPPPPPPAQPGMFDRARAWLQEETLGVRRQNLLLGAAALGTIWYAYGQGWFGGRGARDFW